MSSAASPLPEALVSLGLARGFVTFSEINTHISPSLPLNELEAVVEALNENGISVYEQVPEPMTLGMLISVDSSPTPTMSDIGAFRSADPNLGCRFSFVCDKAWNDLAVREDSPDRFCSKCQQIVRLCLTREEAEEAIAAKVCVALGFPHVADEDWDDA